jgi:predicted nuclease of predicted toxin-antitoxin system
VRFFLDQHVDARLRRFLISRGHQCWSADQANLGEATDDALTIYAQARKAVVVTHDREFSARRRRNTIGMHIFLDCLEPDAVDLMEQHLDDIVEALESSHGDLFVRLTSTRLDISHNWD